MRADVLPIRLLVTFAAVLVTAALAPFASAAAAEGQPQWKAGLAVVKITPEKPLSLLGYPSRPGVFESVAGDIYVKALALEDAEGKRAVIVTGDLVGFQGPVTVEPVAARIAEKKDLRLSRDRLIFNASHTHTGPVVSLVPNLRWNVGHPPMSEQDAKNTVEYTKALQDKMVAVVEAAVSKLEPARLSWGVGAVEFPMSRRMPTPNGVVMAANPDGLTDRTVPVLRVDSADGKTLRGVLFGTACHNVAAGQANVIHGDYAGEAQAALEKAHPGAVALFMAGCGADANPRPMGSLEIAARHGQSLAQEVDRVMAAGLTPVDGPLQVAYARPALPLMKLSKQELEQKWAPIPNFQGETAKQMLAVLAGGQELLTSYEAPVSVWQFGDDLSLVALPAEPVAEYVPLIQEAIGKDKLWVAGFNNDCFGYLPTKKVVAEGGHEAIGITLWAWGQDLHQRVGFFAPEVQDLIVNTVSDLAKQAGRK